MRRREAMDRKRPILVALLALSWGTAARAQTDAPPAATARPADAPRRSNLLRDPFFVEVEAGPSYVALLSVRGDRSAFPSFVSFAGWGPSVGATVGLHALIFSVGVQCYATWISGEGDVLNRGGSLGNTLPGSFYVVATTVEGALRIPGQRVEFSLRVGVGHAFVGGFTSSASGEVDASANGWTLRTGLALDVRVWRNLFVGLDVDAAVANVRRAGISGGPCGGGDPLCLELQGDGDAVMFLAHPRLQVGAHF